MVASAAAATLAASVKDEAEEQTHQRMNTALKRSNAIRRKNRKSNFQDDIDDALYDAVTFSDTSADSDIDASLLGSIAGRYEAAKAFTPAPPVLVKVTPGDATSSSFRTPTGEEANFPWIGTCHFAQVAKPKQIVIPAPRTGMVRGLDRATRCAGESNGGAGEWERLYDNISRTEAQSVTPSSLGDVPMWSPEGTHIPRGMPKGRVAKFVETGLEEQSELASLGAEKAVLVVETPREESKGVRYRFRGLWKRWERVGFESTGSRVKDLKAEGRVVMRCILGGMLVPEH
jgi:hypothetical protein